MFFREIYIKNNSYKNALIFIKNLKISERCWLPDPMFPEDGVSPPYPHPPVVYSLFSKVKLQTIIFLFSKVLNSQKN